MAKKNTSGMDLRRQKIDAPTQNKDVSSDSDTDVKTEHVTPHSLKHVKVSMVHASVVGNNDSNNIASNDNASQGNTYDGKLDVMKTPKPKKPIQVALNVEQIKYNKNDERIGSNNAPVTVSGRPGDTITLTSKYVRSPKGYHIKNSHQSWKIKLTDDNFKLLSKANKIHFDYKSERAGTLKIIYINQRGTRVNTQQISDGYVDDHIDVNNLRLPDGYSLRHHIFQPLVLSADPQVVKIPILGNKKKVQFTVKQKLYSIRPTESHTNIWIKGRVGDLMRISPQEINVPKGYKIRPNSPDLQVWITSDSHSDNRGYIVPKNHPLLVHYVTTQPVYLVIDFIDQTRRLVSEQVVHGSWGDSVNVASLRLPPGYNYRDGAPHNLKLTKMISIKQLNIIGEVVNNTVKVNVVYRNAARVLRKDSYHIKVSKPIGSEYCIPAGQFSRPGYRPSKQVLIGIVGRNRLSDPEVTFQFMTNDDGGVQTPSHQEVKSNNNLRPNNTPKPNNNSNNRMNNMSSRVADKEAEAHKRAYENRMKAKKTLNNSSMTIPVGHHQETNTSVDANGQPTIPVSHQQSASFGTNNNRPKLTKQQKLRDNLVADWTFNKEFYPVVTDDRY